MRWMAISALLLCIGCAAEPTVVPVDRVASPPWVQSTESVPVNVGTLTDQLRIDSVEDRRGHSIVRMTALQSVSTRVRFRQYLPDGTEFRAGGHLHWITIELSEGERTLLVGPRQESRKLYIEVNR
jgi:hypothetical protein